MERRLRACVELQATETGDLAFMYCVEARPGAGYSPMFGMSLPMEEATFFKRDVERLLDAFGSHAVGKEGGVPYGLMLTAVMSKELFGRRPLAVAYMEDMADYRLSPRVVSVECIEERWRYYCEEEG